MKETVDVDFKPLSVKSYDLIKELLETRVSCVTVLSNIQSSDSASFTKLHSLLLNKNEFSFLFKALLAINIGYRDFLIKQTDLKILVNPILKKIYEAESDQFEHESTSILKILVSERSFQCLINSTILQHVPW